MAERRFGKFKLSIRMDRPSIFTGNTPLETRQTIQSVRRDQTLLNDHVAQEVCGCKNCRGQALKDRSILYDEVEGEVEAPTPKRGILKLPPGSPFAKK